ncbi:MAG: hypothetical protein RBR06_09930 [Desulfuromonadaceae bacterium]|nr:hypothetical protein [Desulfuromonadaceae bacterium]
MKFIFKMLLAIIILAIISLGVGVYYLDSIAKKAIEYGGTEALGLTTSLEGIDIALMDGSTSLKNLNIANVEGFDSDTLMRLGSGTVAVNIQSLTEDVVIISEISFSDLTLNIEQKDRNSNVGILMQHINSATGAKTPPSTKTTPQKNSEPASKQFIIERVVLNKIRVNAKISALNNVITDTSVTIPSIKLTNIGKSADGLPMQEVIRELVSAILNASVKNSGTLSSSLSGLLDGKSIDLDSLKRNLSGQIQQKADVEIDNVKQKLLKDVKLPQEDSGLLQQQTDGASNKLKGLLKRE